jgi:hypothetical protein
LTDGEPLVNTRSDGKSSQVRERASMIQEEGWAAVEAKGEATASGGETRWHENISTRLFAAGDVDAGGENWLTNFERVPGVHLGSLRDFGARPSKSAFPTDRQMSLKSLR